MYLCHCVFVCNLLVSRICPVLHQRMKSSCSVRMCPLNPHAPWHHHVSSFLCCVRSWNSPGQAPSSSAIFLVFMVVNSPTYIIFPKALPLHICLAQYALPGLFWGQLPRKPCYFVSKTSPPTSLTLRGVVATGSFPVFPRSLEKHYETSACRQNSKQSSLEPQTQVAICFISNNHNTTAHSSLSYADSFL